MVRKIKLLWIAFASLLLSICLVGPVSAAVNSSGLLSGQGESQAYDVLLRGNGEAIVNVRLNLTNNEDTPLTTLHYQLSGAKVTETEAAQEVTTTTCISTQGTAASPAIAPTVVEPSPIGGNADCPRAGGAYYYPQSQTSYKKVSVTTSGDDLTLTLPSPVASTKTATVVLAYVATGYAKHSIAGYNFAFQTLKADTRVNTVNVAISVDSDYQLANANGNINYHPTSSGASLLDAGVATASVANTNALSSYAQGIGTQGQIIKTESQLSPHESLTVKGNYAKSWWQLHITGIIEWLIIIGLVIGLIVWWTRRKIQHKRARSVVSAAQVSDSAKVRSSVDQKDDSQGSEPQSVENVKAALEAMTVSTRDEESEPWWYSLPFMGAFRRVSNWFMHVNVRPIFFALFCDALVVIVLVIVVGVSSWFWDSVTNYYGYSSSINTFWSGLAAVTGLIGAALLVLLIIFGLPITYGFNKGLKIILKVILYEALYFILVMIIATCLAFLFRDNAGVTPTPYCGAAYSCLDYNSGANTPMQRTVN